MLVRLVPLAMLAWAIAGAAFGLIVDLPVFFRVCALIAVAALPLCSSSFRKERSVTSSRANDQAPLPAALVD